MEYSQQSTLRGKKASFRGAAFALGSPHLRFLPNVHLREFNEIDKKSEKSGIGIYILDGASMGPSSLP
jgi:hypothetical protein